MNGSTGGENPLVEKLCQMRISDMRDLVDTVTEEELHFLLDGVEMNEKLAKYSETRKQVSGLQMHFAQKKRELKTYQEKLFWGMT